jgi:serine/threonine-protein kinase
VSDEPREPDGREPPDAPPPAEGDVADLAAPGAGDGPPPNEPPPAPRRRSARYRQARDALSVAALALAAFATGLLLFNNLIMPRLIHSVAEVRLPDLANLTFEQAEKVMHPMGIQVSRAGERYDPSVPRGFILSQDPPPDTPVRGRKRVMVMVSLGEEYSSVPALFGESLRGARLLVERAGLRVGGITRAPSDDVGEGLVVDSDPPAETVLPRDAVVGLLVSTGSREEVYVMPDLIGREITGVRRSLEALGFRVVTPPAAPSIGAVVVQDPPPGSRLSRGATIVVQATGRMIR